MTDHKLLYHMGPIRMPHLVTPVLGLPYFYCTCGQWQHIQASKRTITAQRMATIKLRFNKHLRESGE